MGNHRFEGIQAQAEAMLRMLVSRLKELEAAGLVARRTDSARPLRQGYV